MMKALCTLITILLPVILFAQTEEANKVCDDKVFTRVEILPDLKNGKVAFEDSLAVYLQKKNTLPDKGNITYTFIVTKQSKILEIKKVEGDVNYEDSLKEALIVMADLWKPALQNSRPVCAYVSLRIDFSKSKPAIKIMNAVFDQADN